jgi:hypothetical protein
VTARDEAGGRPGPLRWRGSSRSGRYLIRRRRAGRALRHRRPERHAEHAPRLTAATRRTGRLPLRKSRETRLPAVQPRRAALVRRAVSRRPCLRPAGRGGEDAPPCPCRFL